MLERLAWFRGPISKFACVGSLYHYSFPSISKPVQSPIPTITVIRLAILQKPLSASGFGHRSQLTQHGALTTTKLPATFSHDPNSAFLQPHGAFSSERQPRNQHEA